MAQTKLVTLNVFLIIVVLCVVNKLCSAEKLEQLTLDKPECNKDTENPQIMYDLKEYRNRVSTVPCKLHSKIEPFEHCGPACNEFRNTCYFFFTHSMFNCYKY